MNKSKSRPSPAIIFAVVALAFSLVGTAVAANDGLYPKLTKSKVKSIAKKQATKQLKANVNNSHVNLADKATDADNLGGLPPANYADGGLAPISPTSRSPFRRTNSSRSPTASRPAYWCRNVIVHGCLNSGNSSSAFSYAPVADGRHSGQLLRGISAAAPMHRRC